MTFFSASKVHSKRLGDIGELYFEVCWGLIYRVLLPLIAYILLNKGSFSYKSGLELLVKSPGKKPLGILTSNMFSDW
jgi:hypothetical protein